MGSPHLWVSEALVHTYKIRLWWELWYWAHWVLIHLPWVVNSRLALCLQPRAGDRHYTIGFSLPLEDTNSDSLCIAHSDQGSRQRAPDPAQTEKDKTKWRPKPSKAQSLPRNWVNSELDLGGQSCFLWKHWKQKPPSILFTLNQSLAASERVFYFIILVTTTITPPNKKSQTKLSGTQEAFIFLPHGSVDWLSFT